MTERADKLLFLSGLVKSRSAAQVLISEGKVFCRGKIVVKPSEQIDTDSELTITERPKYVSRGGLKLEGALEYFQIDVNGDKCVDIGASTGGFTDCLLQHGAKTVYSIEGGHGQLDKTLLEDERVINIENFNARDLSPDITNGLCDTVTVDVSFISQTLLHKNIASVLRPGGKFISLIKPQFEAGREYIGKHGIARSESYEYVKKIVTDSAGSFGLDPVGITDSRITGGDGNKEFTAFFIKR